MGVDAHFPRRAVLNLGHVVPDFTTPSPITTTTAIRTEESNSDATAAVISFVVEGKDPRRGAARHPPGLRRAAYLLLEVLARATGGNPPIAAHQCGISEIQSIGSY